TPAQFDWIGDEGVSKIDGATVSSNFFSLLKVSAYLGRTFTQADEQQNTEPIAVISHNFWQNQFENDKEVLGRAITLQDKVYVIVGVLPPCFYYPEAIEDAQVWTVLNPTGDRLTNRYMCWLHTIGRMKPGVSIEQVIDLQNQWVQANGDSNTEILMFGLHDLAIHGTRTILWILSAIVGFILLIVCANVSNLCLAKALSRDREVAIRRALGANRLRLLWQFTIESLLLSLVGGVIGVIITSWTIAIFRAKIANAIPMADAIRIQPQELLFGLGLSLLVGFFLGVTPFWFVQRSRLANILTERRSISGRHARFSSMLVAGQIAMALILSIGTGLMIRSMSRLSSANVGFNRDNLVTFNVGIKGMNETQRYQFSQDFINRLNALPYVKATSSDSSIPSSPRASSAPVTAEGYTPSPNEKPIRACCHNISPDYFRTLQIPIRQGRDISPEEHQKKDSVVIINEGLTRLFWPDQENPTGQYIDFCGERYRVIGIVADMIQGNIKGYRPNHLFFPFDKFWPRSELKFVVRVTSDPGAIVQQARTILRNIDATLPLYDVSTFEIQLNERISQERFTTAFLIIFASIALLLILIGIYGVVSYAVSQRTREIGIRMALGAQKTTILTTILKQGLMLLVTGLVIGVLGAIGLTRFLSSYLYEVSATDPVTFIFVPLLIIAVSMLACLIPARRAAMIDPMEALRYE
ncbi:MAG: ADOP family duplicated permease, partial [Phycisphaerales bacterium]